MKHISRTVRSRRPHGRVRLRAPALVLAGLGLLAGAARAATPQVTVPLQASASLGGLTAYATDGAGHTNAVPLVRQYSDGGCDGSGQCWSGSGEAGAQSTIAIGDTRIANTPTSASVSALLTGDDTSATADESLQNFSFVLQPGQTLVLQALAGVQANGFGQASAGYQVLDGWEAQPRVDHLLVQGTGGDALQDGSLSLALDLANPTGEAQWVDIMLYADATATPVPEPAGSAALLAGLALLAAVRKTRGDRHREMCEAIGSQEGDRS